MAEELCIHDLDPASCATCRGTPPIDAPQIALNFEAIANAVDDLARHGNFTTKDVAQHPLVQKGHASLRAADRFDQQVGSYLTAATGRLRITQVSPKGQSNAKWSRRST